MLEPSVVLSGQIQELSIELKALLEKLEHQRRFLKRYKKDQEELKQRIASYGSFEIAPVLLQKRFKRTREKIFETENIILEIEEDVENSKSIEENLIHAQEQANKLWSSFFAALDKRDALGASSNLANICSLNIYAGTIKSARMQLTALYWSLATEADPNDRVTCVQTWHELIRAAQQSHDKETLAQAHRQLGGLFERWAEQERQTGNASGADEQYRRAREEYVMCRDLPGQASVLGEWWVLLASRPESARRALRLAVERIYILEQLDRREESETCRRDAWDLCSELPLDEREKWQTRLGKSRVLHEELVMEKQDHNQESIMVNDERDYLRELIATHRLSLQHLNKQAAEHGGPVHMPLLEFHQMRNIREELERLEAKLQRLEAADPPCA